MVSLAGYFIATVASLYTNLAQYERLSQLEETWLPMASLGSDMLYTFQTQITRHENVFLTGEEELDGELETLHFHLLYYFDQLAGLIESKPNVFLSSQELRALQDDYNEVFTLGQAIAPWVANGEDLTISMQKEIQRHGNLQRDILERFMALDEHITAFFILEIQENKAKSLHSTLFIGFLFLVVILGVTLIVGKVADHLLIHPLAAIKENIRRFTLSHDVIEPVGMNPADEVGLLATAFWEMTKDLESTTVSKKYVENIIRNMSGSLVVVGVGGYIRQVNQQAVDLFGYREEELIGQRATVLFYDKEDNPLVDMSCLGDWFFRNAEIQCCNRNGRVFYTHFSGSTMDNESGEMVGLVCVLNDITEMKKAEKKLKQMALYDALTGLANRHLFFDRLEHATSEARRNESKFALLFLDLDKFKAINDTLGHDVGDFVLKEVADRLQHVVRAGDTVSRMGGDEFTIILTGITDVAAVEMVAKKIMASVAKPFLFDDISCQLGVSIGISMFPDHGEFVSQLMTKADQAMYKAKGKGRNTYCFHEKTGSGKS